VTGLGAINALGASPESSFRALLAGERGFSKIRAFDTTGCRVDIAAQAPDPPASSFPAVDGATLTRTAALALYAANSAWQQSGLPREWLGRVGLVLGSAGCGTPALEAYLAQASACSTAGAPAALLRGYPKRAVTDAVASALRLGGPRATINTACSSSAVSVIHAVDLLRAGQCDAVLAGGSDELTRFTLTGFCSLRAVDPAPCRPFDRERRGMSLGEGAGMLMLERLEDARRRGAEVLATVAGTGQSCDADHLTAPDPEGRGAARAIRAALQEGGIDPSRVAFVNAHGTGTPHNDDAEVRGICAALGAHARSGPVHTIKGSVGHCMGAAGAIEAVVAVLTLLYRQVPPTGGLTNPEFAAQLDFVIDSPRPVVGGYGLSNSLGFGGNNAALLFAHPEASP
jgi:3-oxoacyl-[acyl-carrier-protein] synthase II